MLTLKLHLKIVQHLWQFMASLWQFKRNESPVAHAGDPDKVSVDNSSSFTYKFSQLIHCKFNIELNWSKDSVLSTIANTTFKITNTKLYLPIVTLSNKNNVKLVKLLEERFKRPVYWNEY